MKLKANREVEMLEKLNMCSWVVLRRYNAIKEKEEKLNFQLVHEEKEGKRSIFDLFEKDLLQIY